MLLCVSKNVFLCGVGSKPATTCFSSIYPLFFRLFFWTLLKNL